VEKQHFGIGGGGGKLLSLFSLIPFSVGIGGAGGLASSSCEGGMGNSCPFV
jgi:hypothetical protein